MSITSNDPDEIRRQIDETRADLSANVDALGESVRPGNVARRQVDKVKGGITDIKDKVMGEADSAGSSVAGSVGSAKDAVTSAPAAATRKTRGNPWAAGLIAFGAGALLSSVLVFAMVTSSGDPLGDLKGRNPPVPAYVIEARRHQLQLDRSLPERYWQWIRHFVRGDMGKSITGLEVQPLLVRRMTTTLRMVLLAIVVAMLLAVGSGVLSATRQYTPGDYLLPRPRDMEQMRSPEFAERMKQGPVLMMTVMPNGVTAMGGTMVKWFIYLLVVCFIAGGIASHVLPPNADSHVILHTTGMAAFLGFSLALWQMAIWYRRSLGTTVRSTIDGLIYGLITGATFAWLWPR